MGKRTKRVSSAFEIEPVRLEAPQLVLAVDPGQRNCGMAWFEREELINEWACTQAVRTEPMDAMHLIEQFIDPGYDYRQRALVVEMFQLYPTRMQEQGMSAMGTPEIIGAIKWSYLRGSRGGEENALALVMQTASVRHRGCARLAAYRGGTCLARAGKPALHDKSMHRGTNVHACDAEAHGWFWILAKADGVPVGGVAGL